MKCDTSRYNLEDNVAIYQPLENLMRHLWEKMPSLSFVAHKGRSAKIFDVDPDKHYIFQALVFNGIEKVGMLTVEYGRFRTDTDVPIYTIQSSRIKQKKGYKRDEKITIHLKGAVKVGLSVFQRSSDEEVAASIVKDLYKQLDNLVSHTAYHLKGLGSNAPIDLLRYLGDVKRSMAQGSSIPSMPINISNIINHVNFDKYLANHRIAETVHTEWVRGNGTLLRYEKDNTITMVNLRSVGMQSVQSLTTVKSTDELPEMYQTKLGMLKIVEPNQPIESIGVRFAGDFDNCYFIVNGDILTTC
jgi:hypothetical protein